MSTGMSKQFASKDDHLSRVSKDGTPRAGLNNLIAAAVPLSILARARTKDASRSIPGSSVTLRLESITLSFGGLTALADFDLAVFTGEIRAIIGPNGAGKSSLLNVISGIYRPQRGHVWIEGQKLARVRRSSWRGSALREHFRIFRSSKD
jgi:branched-chain amino acid transport system ATP-binding protein